MDLDFELRSDFIPLCDLLKYCGVTETGGMAKHLIAEGLVLVDGEVELRKTAKIRAGQVVSGDGFSIHVA
ncbi:RNA-binding S4 domain-containing protein [Nonomuraea wenchangensis]|uniref:Ribosome-associated protein n=3 Tax=Nonomuraea TaxID=83681 RepID=A0A1I0ISR7_9ACTN|nr:MULTISPECIES: RNA-binding S4 domain-containing protein [Nonomuraea]MED7922883.1 RNA-binding S4 domain-containing protein [Nonomuraea sp. LP-02]QYC43509.1 ribosome-associated protein [Nonomuraea coxensis DSM 45129]SEU00196.1 ribosome-associated protein [Nonomuraea wenchangensis]